MTNSFQDHFKNPRHHKKPPFFQSTIRYEAGGIKLTLFLDVNNKDQIQSFHYISEGQGTLLPYLSALSLILPGKSLEQAKRVSYSDFDVFFAGDAEYAELKTEEALPWCNVAFILIQKLIEDFEGFFFQTMALVKGQKEEELICRCFGVYKSELKNLLIENRSFEVKDLTAKTKAGAGCHSCVVDLDDFYFQVREDYPAEKKVTEVTTSAHKIGDKSTAQWVVLIDKNLKNFCQLNGLAIDLFEIEKLKYPELRIKVGKIPENLSLEKVEEKLIYFLEQSVGLKLTLRWNLLPAGH